MGVKRTTCPDYCQRKQSKARHNRRYYKLVSLNPEYNKEHYKARQLANPDYERKRYQLRLIRFNALPENQQQEVIQKENEYANLRRSNYIMKLKTNDIKV